MFIYTAALESSVSFSCCADWVPAHPLFAILYVADLVLVIIASLKASEGQLYVIRHDSANQVARSSLFRQLNSSARAASSCSRCLRAVLCLWVSRDLWNFSKTFLAHDEAEGVQFDLSFANVFVPINPRAARCLRVIQVAGPQVRSSPMVRSKAANTLRVAASCDVITAAKTCAVSRQTTRRSGSRTFRRCARAVRRNGPEISLNSVSSAIFVFVLRRTACRASSESMICRGRFDPCAKMRSGMEDQKGSSS